VTGASANEQLTDEDVALLTGEQFAHLAVIRPDGTPHVTVTWIDAADGHVLVNSAVGRVKDRYLRRDPRVSVTIHDEGDPYRWIRIDGVVDDFVTGDEAGVTTTESPGPTRPGSSA
jgi:PPOX class probable F420-dependent enzyme